MKIQQKYLLDNQWKVTTTTDGFEPSLSQLVLVFGSKKCLSSAENIGSIKKDFPVADIVFSSTSGEIIDDTVFDDSLSVTAVQFDKSYVKCASTHIQEHSNSFEAGASLIRQLNKEQLVSVLVIADGTKINGSELVTGLNLNRPAGVSIVGGLAGDGDLFEETLVSLNGVPSPGQLVVIGFYGEHLTTATGSFGGWDEFGPERTITKSDRNVLFEIDGKSALNLYKTYLGPYEKELPGSALLFPLALSVAGTEEKLVRTILTIDEANNSMTFAGNIPEGSKVRLMKANFDKLIDASSQAARDSFKLSSEPVLAILISCVGRKIILKERIYEEIDAAREVFGDNTHITGFYSYGEISPVGGTTRCELHNQTMTISTLSES